MICDGGDGDDDGSGALSRSRRPERAWTTAASRGGGCTPMSRLGGKTGYLELAVQGSKTKCPKTRKGCVNLLQRPKEARTRKHEFNS